MRQIATSVTVLLCTVWIGLVGGHQDVDHAAERTCADAFRLQVRTLGSTFNENPSDAQMRAQICPAIEEFPPCYLKAYKRKPTTDELQKMQSDFEETLYEESGGRFTNDVCGVNFDQLADQLADQQVWDGNSAGAARPLSPLALTVIGLVSLFTGSRNLRTGVLCVLDSFRLTF